MKAFFPSALLLVLTTAGPGLAADDLDTYLTEDKGRKVLKEPLTLREEQGGIAGITGTLWTVEPSGKWRVERFRRNKDGSEHRTPMRSGTLSAAQLEALAKTLAARDMAGLPVKTGRKAPVNPHNITITFGKKSATIQGLPARRGHTVAEHIRKSIAATEKADAGVRERFAHVVEAVESPCQEEGRS